MRLTSSTSQIINIQTITSLPHQSSYQQALTLACTMKRQKDPYMHTQTNNPSQMKTWAAKKVTNNNLKVTTNLSNIRKRSNTPMIMNKISTFVTTKTIKQQKIIHNSNITQMMMNNILIKRGRLLIESWHKKALRC